MKNERIEFLQKVMAIDDRLERIYSQTSKKIKTLPMKPGSQVYAKAAVKDAADETKKIVFDSVRHGAGMGEEEAVREQLAEMKKRWKV